MADAELHPAQQKYRCVQSNSVIIFGTSKYPTVSYLAPAGFRLPTSPAGDRSEDVPVVGRVHGGARVPPVRLDEVLELVHRYASVRVELPHLSPTPATPESRPKQSKTH